MRNYLATSCKHTPANDPSLTGKQLQARLAKMGPQAPGLDSWRISELQELPDQAWGWLAEISQTLENIPNAKWPETFTIAAVPLLAKLEGAYDPMDMRLLSIFSVLYRLWAGARSQHLKEWIEQWACPDLHGGRANHEAVEAV